MSVRTGACFVDALPGLNPQCGQVTGELDIWRPHDGQLTNAMQSIP